MHEHDIPDSAIAVSSKLNISKRDSSTCSINISPTAMQKAIDTMEIVHKIPAIAVSSIAAFTTNREAVGKYAR